LKGHKSRRLEGDSQTNEMTRIFNPRTDAWDHFRWNVRMEGLTSSGRATVEALNLNRTLILAIREEEERLGRNPQAGKKV
jgi:hypothetical protein